MSPIVGGALVDYYGGKVVMAWGVTLWSVATFLTPWGAETSLWVLLSMRILLGVAEGVALPSMNNMVSRYQLHLFYIRCMHPQIMIKFVCYFPPEKSSSLMFEG